MWIIDFCEKRLTECLRMSDSFADSDKERQRAWLELAKQWGRVPEETLLAPTKPLAGQLKSEQIKGSPLSEIS
jgi:hypothetical protein